jgi:hypothetical protein
VSTLGFLIVFGITGVVGVLDSTLVLMTLYLMCCSNITYALLVREGKEVIVGLGAALAAVLVVVGCISGMVSGLVTGLLVLAAGAAMQSLSAVAWAPSVRQAILQRGIGPLSVARYTEFGAPTLYVITGSAAILSIQLTVGQFNGWSAVAQLTTALVLCNVPMLANSLLATTFSTRTARLSQGGENDVRDNVARIRHEYYRALIYFSVPSGLCCGVLMMAFDPSVRPGWIDFALLFITLSLNSAFWFEQERLALMGRSTDAFLYNLIYLVVAVGFMLTLLALEVVIESITLATLSLLCGRGVTIAFCLSGGVSRTVRDAK